MKEVIKVFVHWSENSDLNKRCGAVNGEINKEYTLNDFTLRCKAASITAPNDGSYDKVKYTVHFTDGDVATFRLDLTQNEYNPKSQIQHYINLKTKKLHNH